MKIFLHLLLPALALALTLVLLQTRRNEATCRKPPPHDIASFSTPGSGASNVLAGGPQSNASSMQRHSGSPLLNGPRAPSGNAIVQPIRGPASAFHWGQLESSDYREYIANLRAIGCPEATVRDIIFADVRSYFFQRRLAVQMRSNGDTLSNRKSVV